MRRKNHKTIDRLPLIFLVISLLLSACSAIKTPGKLTDPSVAPTSTPQSSPTRPGTSSPIPSKTSNPRPSSTASSTPTATLRPSFTPTPIATSSPTLTETPTITPTYAILRGTVLEQANCRYGPGAAYLYKYGLYPGNNIEIVGRNDPGSWIVIQAIGGTNPCWVKASLLDIHGDVMTVAPASLPLPMSPYYGPLTGVYAERSGNDVTISWNTLVLRAGDDSLQYPYLVEAWLCENGQLSFQAIGAWETLITVQDEPGCALPSHARVYGVEKHGYTRWVTIPWPIQQTPTPTP